MAATHRTAMALLAAVLALWLVVMAATLARADLRGPIVIAVFPPGTATTRVMTTVGHTGGRLVRSTWWPWAFVVHAEGPVVERIAAEGAAWLLPAAPFRFAMTGGCGFAPLDRRGIGVESAKVEQN